MTRITCDIAIYGAGIAGLWLHHLLRTKGYDCVLLEKNAIGGRQTLASQGIIHSGLKYTLGGKVNKLAQSISAMPDRWRDALNGHGDVDLSAATMNAPSQQLLIPRGFMGGIVSVVTKQMLGKGVSDISKYEELSNAGFDGRVISMGEPVLDIPSVVLALTEPYRNSIRLLDPSVEIKAQKYIVSAAEGTLYIAKQNAHDRNLKTQHRPLLMGFLKPAPFPLWGHLVGSSDKPIASITTHTMQDGTLVWYLGGGVAEREKEANPKDLYADIKAALKKYMPALELNTLEWAALPIDRVEGKSDTDGWMPDTPTIHHIDDHLYCWPTKLTFAPLLGDRVLNILENNNIHPSGNSSDFSSIHEAPLAATPWDCMAWTR